MKLFQKFLCAILVLVAGMNGFAQDVTITGSCFIGSSVMVNGGDSAFTTYNGKPVYYNAAMPINYDGSPTTTEGYLYYELAAELSTPEDRWVISLDGQPFYYNISSAALAPESGYLPFDTSAGVSDCGGSVSIGCGTLPPITTEQGIPTINVVMSNGCSIYNGVYNYVDMLNGKRHYKSQVEPLIEIGFDGTQWVLYAFTLDNNGFASPDLNGINPPTTG